MALLQICGKMGKSVACKESPTFGARLYPCRFFA